MRPRVPCSLRRGLPGSCSSRGLMALSPHTGVCSQSQQDAAYPRHPPQESDQAHRVPQQVPERQDRGRTVQR